MMRKIMIVLLILGLLLPLGGLIPKAEAAATQTIWTEFSYLTLATRDSWYSGRTSAWNAPAPIDSFMVKTNLISGAYYRIYGLINGSWQELITVNTAGYKEQIVSGRGATALYSEMSVGSNSSTVWGDVAYVKVTGNFSLTGTFVRMPDAYYTYKDSPAATTVGLDGKIYRFGGFNGNGVLNSFAKYDPATNTWINISGDANRPSARYGAVMATAPDGKIYLFGGQTPYGSSSELYRYDPAQNKWEYINTSIYGGGDGSSMAVLPNGRVIIKPGNSYYTAIYNPATNGITHINTVYRQHAKMVVGNDGKIYLFGGYDQYGNIKNELWRFKDASPSDWNSSWETLSPSGTKPGPRYAHGMGAGPDGKIYVFGGKTDYWNSYYSREMWAYDIAQNAWMQLYPETTPEPWGYLESAAGPAGFYVLMNYRAEFSFSLVPTVRTTWFYPFSPGKPSLSYDNTVAYWNQKVQWAANNPPGTTFELWRKTLDSNGNVVEDKKLYSGTDTIFTTTDQGPGKYYLYRVRAAYSGGSYSGWSAETAYWTAPQPTIANGNPTQINVTWSKVRNDIALKYRIYYLPQSQSGKGQWQYAGETTGNSFTIAGLDPGERYNVALEPVLPESGTPWLNGAGTWLAPIGYPASKLPFTGTSAYWQTVANWQSSQSGLIGQYYKSTTPGDFTQFVGAQIDPNINFDWGTGAPSLVSSLGADLFAVRWEGQIYIPVTGDYVFQITHDDGAKLWVNNQLIFDKWQDSSTTENSNTINLQPGWYPIRLDYYENGGGAAIKLAWKKPGASAFEIIPASNFWPMRSVPNYTPADIGVVGIDPWKKPTGWPNSTSHWIWKAPVSGVNAAPGTVRLKRYFVLPSSANITFYASADNSGTVYLDGTAILTGLQYGSASSVTKTLSAGGHWIEVEANNAGLADNPAGILFAAYNGTTLLFESQNDGYWSAGAVYELWRKTLNPNGSTAKDELIYAGPNTSFTTTDLTYGQYYLFRARVKNVDGQAGTFSSDAVYWTAPLVTSVTPGPGSVFASWPAVGNGVQYIVRYGYNGGGAAYVGQTSENFFYIQGLDPAQDYQVFLQPVLPDGGNPWFSWSDSFVPQPAASATTLGRSDYAPDGSATQPVSVPSGSAVKVTAFLDQSLPNLQEDPSFEGWNAARPEPIVDDGLPGGATTNTNNDAWTWVTNPVKSGNSAHQSNNAKDMHQHYFTWSGTSIPAGSWIEQWVWIPSDAPPREIMLQVLTENGTWDHRAYWGENLINWGTDGTASRLRIGDIPAERGQWVRLVVKASDLGLDGTKVTGIAYTLYDGYVVWDATRIIKPGTALTKWSVWARPGASYSLKPVYGRNGLYAAHFDVNGTNSIEVYQSGVPKIQGKWYRVSVWAKGSGQIQPYGTSSWTTVSNTDWKQYWWTYQATSTGGDIAQGVNINTGSSIDLDDFVAEGPFDNDPGGPGVGGKNFTISFMARADANVNIPGGIYLQEAGNKHRSWASLPSGGINLTTNWQQFTFSGVAPADAFDNIRLVLRGALDEANHPVAVYYDNIIVTYETGHGRSVNLLSEPVADAETDSGVSASISGILSLDRTNPYAGRYAYKILRQTAGDNYVVFPIRFAARQKALELTGNTTLNKAIQGLDLGQVYQYLPDAANAGGDSLRGLLGSYYKSGGGWFDRYLGSRLEGPIDFNWGTGAPPQVAPLGADQFAARYEGAIYIPVTGSYVFGFAHDDSVKFWLGDKLLLDKGYTGTVDSTPAINLQGGRWYPVKIEFYEGVGGAALSFRWQLPGTTGLTVVPRAYLSPVIPAEAPTPPNRWPPRVLASGGKEWSTAGRDYIMLETPVVPESTPQNEQMLLWDGSTYRYVGTPSGARSLSLPTGNLAGGVNISGVNGTAIPNAPIAGAIRYVVTLVSGTDHFTNNNIVVDSTQTPVTQDMVLGYWIKYESKTNLKVSLQLDFSDGSNSWFVATPDQNGYAMQWNQDLSPVADGKWYYRAIPLKGFAGKTISRISLFINDDPDGELPGAYYIDLANAWIGIPVQTWNSQQAKIYPSEATLDSYPDNQAALNLLTSGQLDLRDDPNKLYVKTPGTGYDNRHNYWVGVARVGAWGESWGTKPIDVLPNRTDGLAPDGTLLINGGQQNTGSLKVILSADLRDPIVPNLTGDPLDDYSGPGWIRFSNDGSAWSNWYHYPSTVWDITPWDESFEQSGGVHFGQKKDPNGINTPLNGWIMATDYNTATIRVMSDGGYQGKNYVRFEHDGSPGWKGLVSQSYQIRAGKYYRLTAFIRTNSTTPLQSLSWHPGYAFYSSGFQVTMNWLKPVQASNGWVKGMATWQALNDLTGSVYLYGGDFPAGTTVDYDTVVLEESDVPFGGEWQANYYQWRLAGDNVGLKSVFSQVKDYAGNLATLPESKIYYIVDTTAPVVSASINNGATTVTTTNVELDVSARDDISSAQSMEMRYSFDWSTWTPWGPYMPATNIVLPAGDGQKNVFVQVRDASGNTGTATAVVTLQTSVPVPTTQTALFSSTSGTWGTATVGGQVVSGYFITDPTVVLKVNVVGATQVEYSLDGLRYLPPEPVAPTRQITFPDWEGIKAVYARFGQSVIYSLKFIYDRTPPEVDARWLGDATATNNGTATLVVIAKDNFSRAQDLQYSLDGGVSWKPYAQQIPVTFSGTGYKTVTLMVRDQAGNITTKILGIFN